MNFFSNLNLSKNELQNAVIQPLAAAPSSPVDGQIYWNTTDEKMYVYNGAQTAWEVIGDDVFNNQISIAAGNGLTGDGSFTLNQSSDGTITLAVGAGNLIVANANSIDVNLELLGTAAALAETDNIVMLDESLTAGSKQKKATLADIGDHIISNNVSDDAISLTAGDGLTGDLSFTLNGSAVSQTIDVDSTVVRTSGAQTIGGDKTFSDNVSINGDLTISGAVTTKLSETVNIEDNMVLLNSNETGAPTEFAGIEVERGTSSNVQLRWNETLDEWEISTDGTIYRVIADQDWVTSQLGNRKESFTYNSAGSASQFFDHFLGTRDIQVQVYDSVTYEQVYCDIERTTINRVTITIGQSVSNDLRVVCMK